MVPAHSHKVSRVSWYSGYCHVIASFAYGAFTLCGRSFQDRSARFDESIMQSEPPDARIWVWAHSISLAATLEIDVFFLFLRLLRCFSSPGSRRMTIKNEVLCSCIRHMRYTHVGFPIQRSAGQRIFAPNRSFSQLITSFIGS